MTGVTPGPTRAVGLHGFAGDAAEPRVDLLVADDFRVGHLVEVLGLGVEVVDEFLYWGTDLGVVLELEKFAEYGVVVNVHLYL